MYILSIDTSCDETSVAITEERKVISEVRYSQILTHKEWGGVVPSLAKRAHEERIDWVINEALRKAHRSLSEIDYIAVTQGPGLAIALEVGITKAKELAQINDKKLIAVNHMAGHIYSCFVQNSKGNPVIRFKFPYIALLISGGHTELVLFKNHHEFKVLGKTVDDAAGEAIDKAARMLGFQYPGGPILEQLADKVNNIDQYKFPRPMLRSTNLNMSFSGLKTSFLYCINKMNDQEKLSQLSSLASSFQEAVFDTINKKTERAMKETGIYNIVVGGGVVANVRLRYLIKRLIKKHSGNILFPPYKYLTGDNAAMIGVAAYYKAIQNNFVEDFATLDRVPRLSL